MLNERPVVFSCVLLALLCVCILHSFVVFHSRLDRGDGGPKVVLNRGGIMNAIREESETRARVQAKPKKPSLDKPPLNVTETERIKWFTENYSSFKFLHHDSLSARFEAKAYKFFDGGCKSKPRFFMTWIGPVRLFGPREILSVESVFKFHPNACLLILSRTLDSSRGAQILAPFVARGFRIVAAAPNLPFLFRDTPAEAWLADVVGGGTDPGEIPFPQNLSNILRLLALYKYGGTYIDSDVLALRSFSLRNAIGAQNVDPDTGVWNRLNNAVLVFDKGHPLLFKFIQEFALTYNGNKWGHNGPYLVTRVVNRLINRTSDLFQVQILPPMAFYPVDWTRIRSYFTRPSGGAAKKWRTAKLLQMEGETYAIHLWNKQSREFPVEEDSIIHNVFIKCCVICDHRNFLQTSRR